MSFLRRIYKKIVILCILSLFFTSMQTYAQSSTSSNFDEGITGVDVTQNTSYEEIEISSQDIKLNLNTSPMDYSSETQVYATRSSNFSVYIPKIITLDGQTGEGKYKVKISGEINGNTVVNVVPDETFQLYEQDASLDPKESIQAKITQSKTQWLSTDIISPNEIEGIGIINASSISAGKWSGTFNFQITTETSVDDTDEKNALFAQYFTVNENIIRFKDQYATYSYEDNTVTYSDEVKKLEYLYIPNEIDGEEVIGIDYIAFKGLPSLKEVEIHPDVYAILHYAFQDCTKLETVNMSCRFLYSEAFAGTSSLTTVNQNGELIFGVNNAFENSLYYDNNVQDDGVFYLNHYALNGDAAKNEITLIDNCSGIAFCAFYNNTNLTNVSFPNNSYGSISDYAFSGCSNLQNADMSNTNIEELGSHCFNNNSKLSQIKLSDATTYIGDWCFQYCEIANNELILPSGLQFLGDGAFNHCRDLTNTSIVIPASLKTIGSKDFSTHVFYECAPLTLNQFIVEDENENFTTVNSILYNKNITRLIAYPPAKTDSSYVMPNTVVSLDEMSFSLAGCLREITISDNLIIQKASDMQDAGYLVNWDYGNNLEHAIYARTRVNTIKTNDTNTNYKAIDGVLYSADLTKCWYIPFFKLNTVTLPEECNEIMTGAISLSHYKSKMSFAQSPRFSEIVMGKNISYIATDALYYINLLYANGIIISSENTYYYVDENGKIVTY